MLLDWKRQDYEVDAKSNTLTAPLEWAANEHNINEDHSLMSQVLYKHGALWISTSLPWRFEHSYTPVLPYLWSSLAWTSVCCNVLGFFSNQCYVDFF